MEEVGTTIVNQVAKHSWFSSLPKWIRSVLIVISIVTVVYWIFFLIYITLNTIRKIGAFIFETRNYWTFLCCILILGVGALLLAQFYFGLDPFGKISDWAVNTFNEIRNIIAGYIKGN